MQKVFYEIFNKKKKISSQIVSEFLKEVEELFISFQVDKDVDNLKVLRNKIELLLDKKHKKQTEDISKKEIKLIEDLADRIDDYIEEKGKQIEKDKLIDVVSQVEDNYKKCEKVDPKKSDEYRQYCVKKSKVNYEKELITLQLELLKLEKYIKISGEKLLIIFEWRDAAGKWGTIKRFTEYLNPRWARVVALEKPTDLEKGQWYFQRYVHHLPNAWEMVFFDRSWYNRAGVEPVMWFVDKNNYEIFLKEVPEFEKMLVNSGTKIVKFYFSVSKEIQAERFMERLSNPLKQYKISPIDQESQKLWENYTLAEYNNLSQTDHKKAPWIIINSDDKKRARINAIKYVLNQYKYPERIDKKHLKLDDDIVLTAEQKIEKIKKVIDIKKDLFE